MLTDIVQEDFVINFLAKYNIDTCNMFIYENVRSAVDLEAETLLKTVQICHNLFKQKEMKNLMCYGIFDHIKQADNYRLMQP
jgi:hypothetical protein